MALLAALIGAPLRSARAQDSQSHPVDSALEMMNLKAKSAKAPDFVETTRPNPSDTDFMSIGTKHPTRPMKVRTPAEIKAAEAELDAARDAQLAGHRPAPVGTVKKPKAARPLALQPGTTPR